MMKFIRYTGRTQYTVTKNRQQTDRQIQ